MQAQISISRTAFAVTSALWTECRAAQQRSNTGLLQRLAACAAVRQVSQEGYYRLRHISLCLFTCAERDLGVPLISLHVCHHHSRGAHSFVCSLISSVPQRPPCPVSFVCCCASEVHRTAVELEVLRVARYLLVSQDMLYILLPTSHSAQQFCAVF